MQSLCSGELLETASASLDGKLHQLTWEVQLDRRLNFLGAESLPLREDHQVACLLHDLDEEFREDIVDEEHSFLRDAQLRLYLLHNSEDVGLERSAI